MKQILRPALLCLLLVALAGAGCASSPQGQGVATPQASAAPATVAPLVGEAAHPRLFFRAADIPRLRAEARASHGEIWAAIRSYAEGRAGTSPPAAAPAQGDIDAYRNAGNELIVLAFGCVISDEAGLCGLAKDHLLTYAEWGQWGEGGFRDLGHAHMLQGNALAYDWLFGRLTPAEQARVRGSLGTWAQRMYEASSQPKREEWNNWWGKSYIQNHYWINNSALGLASLALLDEDGRADTWLAHAAERVGRVQAILNAIGDGSWHEGIPYQSYGLTMMLPFLTNLRAIRGTDLLPHAYLRSYAAWRAYNAIPGSTEFLLSYGNFEWDWGNSYQPQNVLRFVAREYRDGLAEWVAQQLVAADGRATSVFSVPWYVFEFLYYDPGVAAGPPDSLPRARVFPDGEAVIWRGGWAAGDLIFGLKTGPYGGRSAFKSFTGRASPWELPCADSGCEFNIGHDHNDSNGFYLYRGGAWLAPESEGVDRYATSLHNTLLIDGQGQYRPPEANFGRLPEDLAGSDALLAATASSPGYEYLAADATRRYKQIGGVADVSRYVLFVRPGYLVMLDSLAADAPHRYEWVGHAGEGVTVEGGWVRGDGANGQVLGVAVAAPQPFETETGDDGRPFVRVSGEAPAEEMRFITVLYPTEAAAWARRPAVSLLGDGGAAAAIRVEFAQGGYRDDVLISYRPGGGIAAGPYTYDGRAAGVSYDGGRLRRLFVYGATYLRDTARGLPLVEGIAAGSTVEVAYAGKGLAISGGVAGGARLYAPGVTAVTVNGRRWSFHREGDHIILGAEQVASLLLPMIVV